MPAVYLGRFGLYVPGKTTHSGNCHGLVCLPRIIGSTLWGRGAILQRPERLPAPPIVALLPVAPHPGPTHVAARSSQGSRRDGRTLARTAPAWFDHMLNR